MKNGRTGRVRSLVLATIISTASFSTFGQVKVGDNPAIIDGNAVLEVESTNKGVLIPRVLLNDAATIAPLTGVSITEGMLIYNLGGTEPNGFYYWNGTQWVAFAESITTLVDDGNGGYTYTSEDGTQTSFNAPSVNVSNGTGAPTGTGTGGDIYVDDATGDIYTYNGTTGAWENQAENVTTLADNGDGTHTYTSEDGTATTFNTPDGSVSTGTGAPTGTGTGGDIYVDDATGDIYTYNGTTGAWENQAENVTTLTDNGDGTHTYTSEDGTATTFNTPDGSVSTGTGAPTGTGTGGDIYVDDATGDIYTYNGTTGAWESQAENVTTLTDNGDGTHTYTSEDGTATTFNTPDGSVSTGTGAPTGTGTGGDIYVDDATGDIYTYNGTTGAWENQAENVTTLVDNGDGTHTYTSEDGTATTFNTPDGSVSTGTGAPTGTGTGGDIYVDDATGDIYTYNGTSGAWENQAENVTTLTDNGDGTHTYTSEDGTATTFNTPDGSVSTGTGAPTGTGTGGDIYVDDATGDIYTYNGTTGAWENQAENVTTLADNGDGTHTYTSEDGTATTFNTPDGSVSTGTGAPTGTGTGGDIYVDDATGDIYTYNGTSGAWESQAETTTSLVQDTVAGTMTYTDEQGTQNVLDLGALVNNQETTTSLVQDTVAGTMTYTDEQGTQNVLDLGALVNNQETTTSLVQDTVAGTMTYTDEQGVQNVLDLGALVNNQETVTSFVDNGDSTFTYTSEDGTVTTYTDAVNDGDTSITNEIQTISKSGSTISLSNGGGNVTVTEGGVSDEPWYGTDDNAGATTNTEEIYSLGNVAIGTSSPDTSAALDVTSTTQGFLPPRMTEAQMNSIASPAEGLIVYCTDCSPKGLRVYDGANYGAIGGGNGLAYEFDCGSGIKAIAIPGSANSGTLSVPISNAIAGGYTIDLAETEASFELSGTATGILTGGETSINVPFNHDGAGFNGTYTNITLTSLEGVGTCPVTVKLIGCNAGPSGTQIVDVVSPTGKTWMDRSLGAERQATSSTDHNSYGCLFQWGRGDDGHAIIDWTGPTTGAPLNGTTSTNSSNDTPGDNLFIIESVSPPYDWRSPQNVNLWQGVSGINNPCPAGYRVPTEPEWVAEDAIFPTQNALGAYNSTLKLSVSGYRTRISGALIQVGSHGHYWSSSFSAVSNTDSRSLIFFGSNSHIHTDNRAYAFSVRCIKD